MSGLSMANSAGIRKHQRLIKGTKRRCGPPLVVSRRRKVVVVVCFFG